MFCGEQFPKHYADAWRVAAPNSTIENLYGPTKATIYTSRYLYSKSKEKELFCKNIIPIGRMVSSDEYQGTLLWMLSDASSYLNGAIIPVEKKGVYMVTLQ
jgi:non-ribosomal peptide synthetase component F